MKDYKLEVHITPREGLLDPEGKAVEHALHALSFEGVEGVRVGRLVTLHLHADDEGSARALTAHLVEEHGYRSFAFLGSGEFQPWHEGIDRWLLDRADGDGSVLVVPTASARTSTVTVCDTRSKMINSSATRK